MENTEYFSLPDFSCSEPRSGSNNSSEYHSDSNNEMNNQDSSGSYSLPSASASNSSHGTSPPRKVNYGPYHHKSPAPLPPKTPSVAPVTTTAVTANKNLDSNEGFRKALVIYEYGKKTPTEVSLQKSQVVHILDAKPGAEWWRVQDEIGRVGYYPSHYLRMV